jgi:hypothetical protein
MRFLGIIITILLFNSIELDAQKYNAESEPAIIYVRNLRDTALSTGFYKINPMFNEEDWTYKVRYTQTQKVVDVKRRFLVFGKSEPMRYIHSTVKREVDPAKNFIREFRELEYKVDPLPLAVRQNVVKADTFKIKTSDSTFYYRIHFHLNFIDDTSLCINGEPIKKCPLVGLVINNQLIAIAELYNKQFNGTFYRRYLVFQLYKKTQQQLEMYIQEVVQDKYN